MVRASGLPFQGEDGLGAWTGGVAPGFDGRGRWPAISSYLNPFDHFVKRELRCPGYVRYVDDFVLFGDEKRVLWEWKARLVERLARLRLTIHPGAHPQPVTEGLPFLGFIVYPHRRRLKRRKGIHFARKLRALLAQCAAGAIPVSVVTASVRSWVSHAAHGNTMGLRKALLGKIRLKPPKPQPQ